MKEIRWHIWIYFSIFIYLLRSTKNSKIIANKKYIFFSSIFSNKRSGKECWKRKSNIIHSFSNATLITWCSVQPCWRLLMNDHFCTALTAASGDPVARIVFHKSNGKIWAFCKRNATSKNAIIHYKIILKTNWKSRWNNVATLTLKPNWMKIITNYTEASVWKKSYFKYFNTLKLIKSNDCIR